MNYGLHVRDLLLELQRSDGPGDDSEARTLPKYNDAKVAAALQDFQLHVQALHDQVHANQTAAANAATGSSGGNNSKPSMAVRPSILLQNAACQRNKRGLLAYHWERLQRLQEIHYWRSGTDNDDTDVDGDNADHSTRTTTTANLNPAEVAFLHDYRALVARYTARAVRHGVLGDLRAHGPLPPSFAATAGDQVVVRVVDAAPFSGGDNDNNGGHTIPVVVLESGQTVVFTEGSTHCLPYADCEEYIRSGALLVLDTEEQQG